MTLRRGYRGQFSKQTHSGKIGCLKDEAGVSRTPNVNTGDTYYNYEMHTLTSLYVRATNDVDVPCTLSFLPFSVFRECEFFMINSVYFVILFNTYSTVFYSNSKL